MCSQCCLPCIKTHKSGFALLRLEPEDYGVQLQEAPPVAVALPDEFLSPLPDPGPFWLLLVELRRWGPSQHWRCKVPTILEISESRGWWSPVLLHARSKSQGGYGGPRLPEGSGWGSGLSRLFSFSPGRMVQVLSMCVPACPSVCLYRLGSLSTPGCATSRLAHS